MGDTANCCGRSAPGCVKALGRGSDSTATVKLLFAEGEAFRRRLWLVVVAQRSLVRWSYLVRLLASLASYHDRPTSTLYGPTLLGKIRSVQWKLLTAAFLVLLCFGSCTTHCPEISLTGRLPGMGGGGK